MNKNMFAKIWIPIIAAVAGGIAGAMLTHILESSTIEKSVVRVLSKYYDSVDINMSYEEALEKSYEEYKIEQSNNKILADQLTVAKQKEDENNDKYNELKTVYDALEEENKKLTQELNNSKRSEEIITQAKQYADEGRLDLAISLIDSLDFSVNPEARVLEQEYIERFEQQTIETVNRYINSGDYDSADSIIAEALSAFPNSATLYDMKEKISKLKPAYLFDVLSPYETEYYHEHRGPGFMMGGEEYTNGFTLGASGTGRALYNLKGNYKTLQGVIGHTRNSNYEDKAYFYIDGILMRTIVVKENELPKSFEIDLTDAKQLIISSVNSVGFAELKIR